MKTNSRFPILTTLIVLLICGTPLIAEAQLFDGEREGLLTGGGIGYAIATSDDFGSGAGFAVNGRIGYGLSDQTIIYLSTSVLSLTPSLGIMSYTDRNSDYYLLGGIGYASADQDTTFSLSGGLGYELRKHVSLELMLGYNRYSDTYTSSFNIFTGETFNETTHYNIITIAASFNVFFY